MKKIWVWVLTTVIVITTLYCFWAARLFPYGNRNAFLPLMVAALQTYAADHDGRFPNKNGDPFGSLVELYPKYHNQYIVVGQ